jgi:RHS repeat-associated protein
MARSQKSSTILGAPLSVFQGGLLGYVLALYTYDQLNRLTGKTYPDTTTVNYTSHFLWQDSGLKKGDSRLTQACTERSECVSDPTGTYQFTVACPERSRRNNMGRLTGTTTSYAFLTGRNFTTGYGYDAASNRTSFTDPESGSTAYVYDTLNRLQTLTPPAAISGGSFGFGYDALSRRTSLTRPNSVNTSYSYDNLSRLLSVTHAKGGVTLDGATYTLDNAGNRNSKVDLYAGVTTNYGYDNIYELLSATQGGSTKESYTYDPVGNRLSNLSGSGWSNNTSNELSSRPGVTYTYGNTLTKTDSTGKTNYTWDFENRLTSVTLPGSGGTVSFKYDPFGRRIYKSSSGGTSVYAYDGDNMVEETNGAGAAVARYSQGLNIDEPLAMLRSATTSYYQADGLGSVTSLTNAAGTAAQNYTYDSFGNLIATTGSLVNSFRYTGREWDAETGLYYYRARYYDPNIGRFISEDPARSDDNQNFFKYALNNPTIYLDPSGLFVEILCEPITQYWLGYWRRVKHCRVHVKCGSLDKTFELEGPRPGSRHGNPRAENFDPSRPADPRIPVQPPKDSKDCSSSSCDFENSIARQFNFYFTNQQALPDYHSINSNSNQFAKDLVSSSGGNVYFPFLGGFYGEVH